jgi:hypothetical protein
MRKLVFKAAQPPKPKPPPPPPKADIDPQFVNVRFVPKADISARPELFNLPYSAPDPRLGHSR